MVKRKTMKLTTTDYKNILKREKVTMIGERKFTIKCETYLLIWMIWIKVRVGIDENWLDAILIADIAVFG